LDQQWVDVVPLKEYLQHRVQKPSVSLTRPTTAPDPVRVKIEALPLAVDQSPATRSAAAVKAEPHEIRVPPTSGAIKTRVLKEQGQEVIEIQRPKRRT
jgi:hypothetical protein